MSDQDLNLEKITTRILNSRKYRSLYRPTVTRIVEEMARRFPAKQVEKAVKRKLHQVWGAYYLRPDFGKLLAKVRQEVENGKDIQQVMSPLLMLQSSTKERLPILDRFYKEIFALTGVPKTIVEPACGVNALTYFWMNPSVKYTGYDVDQGLMDFMNQVFELAGVQKRARVDLGDILIKEPAVAEVGFFLKVLTILEKQKAGCSREILQKTNCRYLVVSYPTRSLSGREKGMVDFYTKQFADLIRQESWQVEKLLFETELVFVVKK